jgi:UDP-2,3-diacylglucosamine pyrophosphatase LpxH/glycosyltransferase involved in cell wall biosynthesis
MLPCPMHIEIVTDTFVPDVNGVAMTLGKLTDGLRGLGHRVRVIRTGDTGGSTDEIAAASFRMPGYPQVRVGVPKPFELRSRWLEQRPDVIYIATEGLLGKSALKTADLLGIPAATGFHTNFHQYVGRYLASGFERVAMGYLRDFHRRARCTFTPSPEVAQALKSEGIGTVHVLGRGVDSDHFHPSKRCADLRTSWGASDTTPVAVIVGRVAAEKNLELGIAAFRRMREQRPDLRCLVIGDGPLRQRLEQEHPWIRFTGALHGDDLARHYASCDILLFPSETETFGNVLLEGMASGLVTVSYDYAAADRHVRCGHNGFKAATGNAIEFVHRTLDALATTNDHPLRINARQTAESLGWNRIVAEFGDKLAAIADPPGAKTWADAVRESGRKFSCRTVFLSDLHLGSNGSKADEIVAFLKSIRCSKLVLNGDIIDGWALRRGSRWEASHTRVIRRILKMTERHDTEVVYLRGNHDEILERFLPLALGRIRIVKEHIHVTADGKRYLVVHGDGFDSVSTGHKWVAMLGAVGYDILLEINRLYNRWRRWQGREPFSLSKVVKAKVKSAVSFIDRYEELLQQLARRRGCDGIICGHIHTPEDKRVGDIHYLNSGDWVESLSAIIEHHDGRLELVHHHQAPAVKTLPPQAARPESVAATPADAAA